MAYNASREAPVSAGGNFYLADYGIKVENSADMAFVWQPKMWHGTTFPEAKAFEESPQLGFSICISNPMVSEKLVKAFNREGTGIATSEKDEDGSNSDTEDEDCDSAGEGEILKSSIHCTTLVPVKPFMISRSTNRKKVTPGQTKKSKGLKCTARASPGSIGAGREAARMKHGGSGLRSLDLNRGVKELYSAGTDEDDTGSFMEAGTVKSHSDSVEVIESAHEIVRGHKRTLDRTTVCGKQTRASAKRPKGL